MALFGTSTTLPSIPYRPLFKEDAIGFCFFLQGKGIGTGGGGHAPEAEIPGQSPG